MDVRESHPRIVAAGGQVAIVTMSDVAATAEFRASQRLPFVCLSDPDRVAYRAFRLGRGTLGQVAGPRVWLSGLKSIFRAGAGRPRGDVWQMPGTFIIDRAGRLRLAHYPSHSADRVAGEEILAVLERIRETA